MTEGRPMESDACRTENPGSRRLTSLRTTSMIIAALVLVSTLTLFPLASASPWQSCPATMPSGCVQWAYGGEGSFTLVLNNTSAANPSPTYTAVHAWVVDENVFTVVNTSSTTFSLEVQRFFEGSFFLTLCTPSCSGNVSNPSGTSTVTNMTYEGWASETLFANFTTDGELTLDGSSFGQALALENAAISSEGNMTFTLNTSTMASGSFGGNSTYHNMTLYESMSLDHARAHESFSPALGILPIGASLGLASEWSSSSSFTASGGGLLPYHVNDDMTQNGVPVGSPITETGTANLAVPASGTVTLTGGIALLGIDLDEGVVAVVVYLNVGGPFVPSEGIILLPPCMDLFSPSVGSCMAQNSSSGTSPGSGGGMSSSTGQSDFLSGGGMGPVASNTSYGGSAPSSGGGATSLGPFSKWTAGTSHMSTSQGEPESTGTAAQVDSSLGHPNAPVSTSIGSGVATPSNGSTGPLSNINLILIIALLGVVGAIFVVLLLPKKPRQSTRLGERTGPVNFQAPPPPPRGMSSTWSTSPRTPGARVAYNMAPSSVPGQAQGGATAAVHPNPPVRQSKVGRSP